MTTPKKSAIVTAASRGIGRAIALRLGLNGTAVAVNYHSNLTAAEQVVGEITAGGGSAIAAQGDMGVQADVERLFDTALERFGGLDILVTNAASQANGKIADVTDETFDRAVEVNIKGTFRAMRLAANKLNEGGRVVNISTGCTRAHCPDTGAYSATKIAGELLAVALAKELGHRRITVNSVLPGLVDTDGILPHVRQQFDMIASMTPLGRIGQPGDIADIVAYLVSEQAGWITGQSIVAAGGLG
ncbi:SDR family oxidoreductase [Amycolatopsis panacis]|uniref:SDR family oxidoreductase n=1 Tax=Amycolatopsis panacis TaxID=2340917 RepID=A0A419HX37_9PSEU|nr:SDR family oxidoreductase [Amycolatopsis panacis]RJQ81681.1 SDR family oxidoreductase [Amycolatopsis panacis]